MKKDKPYVEVCVYNHWDDPSPPNNCRPELVVGNVKLLPDFRDYVPYAYMTKKRANLLAKKIASRLGIEARLK